MRGALGVGTRPLPARRLPLPPRAARPRAPAARPASRSSCSGTPVLADAFALGCSTTGGVTSFTTCYQSGAGAARVSAAAALLVAVLAVVSSRAY